MPIFRWENLNILVFPNLICRGGVRPTFLGRQKRRNIVSFCFFYSSQVGIRREQES